MRTPSSLGALFRRRSRAPGRVAAPASQRASRPRGTDARPAASGAGTPRSGAPWRDDGLTLSHFVTGSVRVTKTGRASAEPAATATAAPAPAPAAVELGDEFDDAFAERDALVTDAMSCRSRPGATPSDAALDRLGRQMRAADAGVRTLSFHLKTFGCQMNVNDSDIVRAILLNHRALADAAAPEAGAAPAPAAAAPPLRFVETRDELRADVLLTNTCAIREKAEDKVWHRLRELRAHDRNFPLDALAEDPAAPLATRDERRRHAQKLKGRPGGGRGAKRGARTRIVGVLGCMAERLKEDMFRDGSADLVVGPDAYRDLPRLLAALAAPALPTERAVNVRLSLDETYGDIAPVRSDPEEVSAFVSIARGCNNMCSYCVVPFTRGRERSREMESVVAETKRLLEEEDIKEVILLGQNVNSYHDARGEKRGRGRHGREEADASTYRTSNEGFSNLFRLRHADGHRFADLLEAVADLSPELRVRFTSPHPKDYPPALLTLMAERPNICSHLHMPAQSGSSAVLRRMRRGYTREAYLALIEDVRRTIPDVALSSDFITGFCGETEAEHRDTLALLEGVRYDQAYMFAYSMRGKTHAQRTMEDDVPADVKGRRLHEIVEAFRRNVQLRNDAVEVGQLRLVLVEGEAKRSTAENRTWSGRTDQNKRVVFDSADVWMEEEVNPFLSQLQISSALDTDARGGTSLLADLARDRGAGFLPTRVQLSRGDYAVVQITEARGHTLKGQTLWRASIEGFERSSTNHHGGGGASDGHVVRQLLMQ